MWFAVPAVAVVLFVLNQIYPADDVSNRWILLGAGATFLLLLLAGTMFTLSRVGLVSGAAADARRLAGLWYERLGALIMAPYFIGALTEWMIYGDDRPGLSVWLLPLLFASCYFLSKGFARRYPV